MIPGWLTQSVPLWAFLLAVLTHPATWAKRARKIVKERMNMTTKGENA